MIFTRRSFLTATMAGLATLPRLGRAQTEPDQLVAAPSEHQLLPLNYGSTQLWTFNDQFPGEALSVRQGQRFRRRLVNRLAEPTSIHWHGIRIDNAMDGVPGLTQEAVQPDALFDYDFVVPDAGTFWYHSHNRSTEQVARGLYGPMIVQELDPPDVDQDITLMLDDIRLEGSGLLAEGFDNLHDRSHAGRIGNVMLTNGVTEFSAPVRRHERLRLRLVNASNARVMQLGLQGLEGWTVALDGMPLETPQPVRSAFLLAPAQRIDLIVDVIAEGGDEAFLVHFEGDGGFAQRQSVRCCECQSNTRRIGAGSRE